MALVVRLTRTSGCACSNSLISLSSQGDWLTHQSHKLIVLAPPGAAGEPQAASTPPSAADPPRTAAAPRNLRRLTAAASHGSRDAPRTIPPCGVTRTIILCGLRRRIAQLTDLLRLSRREPSTQRLLSSSAHTISSPDSLARPSRGKGLEPLRCRPQG